MAVKSLYTLVVITKTLGTGDGGGGSVIKYNLQIVKEILLKLRLLLLFFWTFSFPLKSEILENWSHTSVGLEHAQQYYINQQSCYLNLNRLRGCLLGITLLAEYLFDQTFILQYESVPTNKSKYSLGNVSLIQTDLSGSELFAQRSATMEEFSLEEKNRVHFEKLMKAVLAKTKGIENKSEAGMARALIWGFLEGAFDAYTLILPHQTGLVSGPIPAQVEASLLKTKEGFKVGHLKIKSFSSASVFEEVFRTLKSKAWKNIEALYLDLRDNPGGMIWEAGKMADLFLEQGTPLFTVKLLNGYVAPTTLAAKKPLLPNIPLIIFQNEKSKSAAELFSALMGLRQRALIIGRKSYGKGTVQNKSLYPYDENFTLYRTTGWYLAAGTHSPHLIGVTPHIEWDEQNAGLRMADKFQNPLPAQSDPVRFEFPQPFTKCGKAPEFEVLNDNAFLAVSEFYVNCALLKK